MRWYRGPNADVAVRGDGEELSACAIHNAKSVRCGTRGSAERPKTIGGGAIPRLRRCVNLDIGCGGRRRRENNTIHIELLVGSLGADTEILRAIGACVNVACRSSPTSEVGGGSSVCHEAEVAASS